MKSITLMLCLSALVSGCATIHSTSLSNISFSTGTRLTGSESAKGFLHLTTPAIDDLTNNLIARMKKGCESGNLANVQTTLIMRELIIVQSYEVTITASCLPR